MTKTFHTPVPHLTDKQRIFIAEYTKDFNATKAAREAGYSTPDVAAWKLLDARLHPLVANAIRQVLEERRKACEIEARQLVLELAKIAFFNPKNMLDDKGNVLPLNEMPDEVAAVIREIHISHNITRGKDRRDKPIRHRVVQVKFHDKLNALRQLALHLGLMKDVINVNNISIRWEDLFRGPNVIPDEIENKLHAVEQLAYKATNTDPAMEVLNQDDTEPPEEVATEQPDES